MLGNVWEWTWDWLVNYPGGPATDPTGPESALYRVLRGGSWYDNARNERAARRSNDAPARRNRSYGFRPVRSARQRR